MTQTGTSTLPRIPTTAYVAGTDELPYHGLKGYSVQIQIHPINVSSFASSLTAIGGLKKMQRNRGEKTMQFLGVNKTNKTNERL